MMRFLALNTFSVISVCISIFASTFNILYISSQNLRIISTHSYANSTCACEIPSHLNKKIYLKEEDDNITHLQQNGTKFEVTRLNDSILSVEKHETLNNLNDILSDHDIKSQKEIEETHIKNITETNSNLNPIMAGDKILSYEKQLNIFENEVYQIKLFRQKKNNDEPLTFSKDALDLFADLEKYTVFSYTNANDKWTLLEDILNVNNGLLHQYDRKICVDQVFDEEILNQIKIHKALGKNTKFVFEISFFEIVRSSDSLIDLSSYEAKLRVHEIAK